MKRSRNRENSYIQDSDFDVSIGDREERVQLASASRLVEHLVRKLMDDR